MKDSKELRLFFVISTLFIILLTSVAVYQIYRQSTTIGKCVSELTETNKSIDEVQYAIEDLHFKEIVE